MEIELAYNELFRPLTIFSKTITVFRAGNWWTIGKLKQAAELITYKLTPLSRFEVFACWFPTCDPTNERSLIDPGTEISVFPFNTGCTRVVVCSVWGHALIDNTRTCTHLQTNKHRFVPKLRYVRTLTRIFITSDISHPFKRVYASSVLVSRLECDNTIW